MGTATLTAYRRRSLYATALRIGAEDVDGGVDKAHLLVHALAETPDGPVEFRENFMDEDTVPEREWTPQEEIASAIDFYGVPREDPEAGDDSPAGAGHDVQAERG